MILKAEPSRSGLRSIHGAPDSIAVKTEPNRHIPDAVDSLFTVFYPRFTATFRTPPSGRDLISSARISDNQYIAHPEIGIGASEQDVIRRLGEPTRREDGRLVYDCGEVEQPVAFEIVDGRVRAIAIEYYVD